MNNLLVVEDLRVTYGGVTAVDGVSLTVGEGEIVGLIGPNGAGKSSLIDALTGYHPAAGGRVTFAGAPLRGARPYAIARRGLIRTFQSVELFDDLTVEENLLVAAEQQSAWSVLRDLVALPRTRRNENVAWAMDACGLEDVAGRMPGQLSHGRRKLVGVARALSMRPRLVLMDEPAAGLDNDESLAFGERVAALPGRGVSVLLVDHDMGLVLSLCDRSCTSPAAIAAANGGATGMYYSSPVQAPDAGTTQSNRYMAVLKKYAPKTIPVDSLTAMGFATVMNVQAALAHFTPAQLTTAKILAAFRSGSDHPNFMAHAYTCDGKQLAGATAVCNAYQQIRQVQGTKIVVADPNWITAGSYYKG